MIDITLRFATLELAITALAAVRSAESVKAEAPKAEAAAPSPTKPKAKDTKPAETAPTADTAPTAASPTPPTASSGPSRDQIAAEIKAGVVVNRAAVVATLEKFGAKAGKDLKDADLGAFSTALAEALKGGEDLA